ncbi:MAG: Stp1/IreP family PP2C-type Ser/Thr phosphatase [Ignavibacteriales bacterium]|nr:MAG: Stp1/IreP family PP2C-type Ser/Thr phosphatase [Ignavibacteriales bacterium]
MSSSSSSQLFLKFAGNTDIGLVRTENQDSLGKYPDTDLDLYTAKGQLFIVADGMGGHTGGKLASSLAVETVINDYSQNYSSLPADALKQAIETANDTIFKKAQGSTEYNRMGTTFVSLLLKEDSGIIGHVGDSRIYKIENGQITQLTEDHTKVNEMLREGILTPQEAENYPSKSVLARALGVIEKVKVDIIKDIHLKAGQTFVLCTDGLAKVSKEEILEIIKSSSPDDACSTLINLANERGGKDNVTVQIVSVGETSQPVTTEYSKEKLEKKSSKTPLLFFLAVLLLAAGFFLKDSVTKLFSSESNPSSDTTSVIINPVDPELANLNKGEDELLALADKTFKSGKIDNALIIYQKILSDEPMHLAALKGLNKIAESYLHDAEKFREKKNFVEALRLYYKVAELQPENEKIFNLIRICEHQIMYGSVPEVENQAENNVQTTIPPKEVVPIFTTTKFVSNEWNFNGLNLNHFEMTNSGIAFASSAIDKIISLNQKLNDIVVSSDIRIFSAPDESRIGIVCDRDEDSYLLFCVNNKNKLVLLKVSGENEEEVESFSVSQIENDAYKIKIQCSGQQINLYSNDKQIGQWKSPDKLSGEVGFFSGKYVSARISNIIISGKKKQ